VSAIWLPSFLVALRDAASFIWAACVDGADRTRTESKDDAPAAAADSRRETGREHRTVSDDCRKVGIFVNVNGPPVDGTGPEITFLLFKSQGKRRQVGSILDSSEKSLRSLSFWNVSPYCLRNLDPLFRAPHLPLSPLVPPTNFKSLAVSFDRPKRAISRPAASFRPL